MKRAPIALAALTAATFLSGVAAAGTLHIYSYDPADAVTRQEAGALTFAVHKGLLGGTTVLELMSTVAQADADLKRADGRALGPGGLAAALGPHPGERDLYQIEPADQGAALISVLCPGAKRAWMAFGPVRFDQPLKIEVLGDQVGAAGARVCHRLDYDFHGEWLAPASGPVINEKEILHGRFPGT